MECGTLTSYIQVFWSGDWHKALDAALEDANSNQDSQSKAKARAWASRMRSALGQVSQAKQDARVATQLAPLPMCAIASAEAAIANGKPPLAYTLIKEAWDSLPTSAEIALRVDMLISYAHIEVARGQPAGGYGKSLRAVAEAENQPLFLRAAALVAVGHAALALGKFDESLHSFEAALDIRKGMNDHSPWVAECLDGIGRQKRHAGHPFESVRFHEQACAVWEQMDTEPNGPLAACHHALAHARYRTGNFEAARDEMSKAVLMTATVLGHDHIDTWISRFELARYEIDCGDLTHGFQQMVEARDVVARRLGAEHPVVRSMDRFL